MVAWVTSLKGALTLSTIAMLSFIGYALLVFRYVIDQLMPGIPGAILQTAFVLLLIGGWIWSLYSAILGSRGGLIVVLICTSLPALFTLYDLVFYSPVRFGWPLVQISVWTTFLLCIVAIATLVFQLITSKPAV
ncbi:MAG: hypothetical protein GTO18_04495 [Anaerolineales bacterium]|nr:hypothetical protein [Anaerolineales bacterium]